MHVQTLNCARTHIWRHRSNTDQHVPHSHTSRLRLQANSQGPVSHILDNVDFFRWVQKEPQAENRSHYSLIGIRPAKHHHSLIHVHQKGGTMSPRIHYLTSVHRRIHPLTRARASAIAQVVLTKPSPYLELLKMGFACNGTHVCVAMRCQ